MKRSIWDGILAAADGSSNGPTGSSGFLRDQVSDTWRQFWLEMVENLRKEFHASCIILLVSCFS